MKPQIAQISTESGDEKKGDPQTYAIIGAAMEVHKELGPGFLEVVYQQALALEFGRREIPFHKEKSLPVLYKEMRLDCGYRADFVCYESIIVEIKAVECLNRVHAAQVINYLKASGCKRGLLLNFSADSLEYKRLVY